MDPLSLAVTAGGSLISGLIGWGKSKSTARENRWLQENAQQWQTSEREASQVWQNEQRIAQNQYSEDMYNKYSSPQAMAQQYEEAGLNPRLAMGGSPGQVQANSGSTGGAPVAPGTTAPYQSLDVGTNAMQGIASMIKTISEAQKIGLDTDLLRSQFDNLVKGLSYETAAKEFYALVGQRVDNAKKLKEIQKLGVDIANGSLTGDLLKQKIRKVTAEAGISENEFNNWYKNFESLLNKRQSETDLNNQRTLESEQAVEESKQRVDESKQSIEESKSRVGLNRASASELYSRIPLNESLVRLNDSNVSVNEFKREFLASQTELNRVTAQFKRLDIERLSVDIETKRVLKRTQESYEKIAAVQARIAKATEKSEIKRILQENSLTPDLLEAKINHLRADTNYLKSQKEYIDKKSDYYEYELLMDACIQTIDVMSAAGFRNRH